jgi:dCMP deaminase
MSDLEPAILVSTVPAPNSQPSRISIPSEVDNWDEYFLHVATAVSIKSKDPRCPVGAVIATKDNIILSTGFNGLARGVRDDDRTLLDAAEKLKVICHAENNAIINAARVGGRPLEGATIYVTKFPCLACCNAVVQAGIDRIYTHDNSFWDDDPADPDHSRKLRVLREARIEVDAPFLSAFNPTERIIVPKKPSVRETELPAKVKVV